MGWKPIWSKTVSAYNGPSVTANSWWISFGQSFGVAADLRTPSGGEFAELLGYQITNLTMGNQYRLKASFSSIHGGSFTLTSRSSTKEEAWIESFTTRNVGGQYTCTYTVEQYVGDPTTPSYLDIPTAIKVGDAFSISWGSSSSPGGGSITYQLQRSVNGGSYTTVYTGTNRSFQDTGLETWNTVSYRVRASDPWGTGSYRTSSTVTIIHFPEFKMKVDGALKISEMGWVKIDGQLREIDSIKIKIDGVLKEV